MKNKLIDDFLFTTDTRNLNSLKHKLLSCVKNLFQHFL